MKQKLLRYLPFVIIFLFFASYATLSVIKHLHFLSGYDLSILDQVTWKYSNFKAGITTTHAYALTNTLTDHVELIWIFLSPLYWIFNSALTLLIAQTAAITLSGIPVFLLMKRKKINNILCISLLISYLMFFGIQFAIWSDVHSLVFAASFLAWFLYFLDVGDNKKAAIFFILAITCKEDIGLFTFCISFLYVVFQKRKAALVFMVLSALYLLALFVVYYPIFTTDGYRYQNPHGLLSNINLVEMVSTSEKRDILLYAFGWFGGISLLAPAYILTAFADLAHYFILGSQHTSGQGIFGHYRSTLALFLIWPVIIAISRYRLLNNKYVAVYILIFAFLLQYHLHLPLSYLTKKWFWTEARGVKNIEQMLKFLPTDASVVSQVNITPHITHREEVFTLWPQQKAFGKNSPCGESSCHWLGWVGTPTYMLVDLSPEWDIRHLLATNEDFKKSVANLEKAGIIKKKKGISSTILYQIIKHP